MTLFRVFIRKLERDNTKQEGKSRQDETRRGETTEQNTPQTIQYNIKRNNTRKNKIKYCKHNKVRQGNTRRRTREVASLVEIRVRPKPRQGQREREGQ